MKKIKAAKRTKLPFSQSHARKIASYVDGDIVVSTLCAIEDRGRQRFAIAMQEQCRWRFLDWAPGDFLHPVLVANAPVLSEPDFLPHPQLQAWLRSSLAQQDAELEYDASAQPSALRL